MQSRVWMYRHATYSRLLLEQNNRNRLPPDHKLVARLCHTGFKKYRSEGIYMFQCIYRCLWWYARSLLSHPGGCPQGVSDPVEYSCDTGVHSRPYPTTGAAPRYDPNKMKQTWSVFYRKGTTRIPLEKNSNGNYGLQHGFIVINTNSMNSGCCNKYISRRSLHWNLHKNTQPITNNICVGGLGEKFTPRSLNVCHMYIQPRTLYLKDIGFLIQLENTNAWGEAGRGRR